MATTTTLGFSILSRYSGHGVTQARRDLVALRAQMATINGDLQRQTNFLNNLPMRWRAIGIAAAGVAPAILPIAGAVLQVSAAFVVMSASVGAALGAYGAAMAGAIKKTMEMAREGKALTSTQKAFVGAVEGMRKAWQGFISDTQSKTLATATHVVKGLTAGVAHLKVLVDAIHPSVLQVAKDFESWMKGDSAKNYANLMAAIAKTTMPNLVAAGKAVLNVLGDGFRAFAPLTKQLSENIRKGAEALNSWSDNGGFQRFIAYNKENLPNVLRFFQAFGDAIRNVFNIIREFNPAGIQILTDGLRAIAALNPEAVKAFANALLLLKAPLLWLVLNCPPLRNMIITLLGAMNPQIVYAIAAAFVALRVAFLLMNTALLTTPLGWVILGLTALGVAITVIATKTTWFQTAWTYTWNFIKEVATTVFGFLTNGLGQLVLLILGPVGALLILLNNWTTVWNAIKLAASVVWSWMQTAWNVVCTAFTAVWNAVSSVFSATWSAAWNAIRAVAETVWNGLKAAWQVVANVFGTIWNVFSAAFRGGWSTFWETMRTIATGIWNALTAAWQLFFNVFRNIFNTAMGAIKGSWELIWNAIKAFAEVIWNALKGAWQLFFDTFRNIFNTAMGAIMGSWEKIWNTIKDVADKIWHEIGEIIEKAINAVVGIINGLISGFNKITSFLKIDVSIGKIDKVNFDFAEGGMVGLTPYMIGGMAQPFAHGGVANLKRGGTLSGYAPGRDTVPAVLSRGEGVLTPEAVRGMGGPGFVHAANRTFAGHRGAGKLAKAPLSRYTGSHDWTPQSRGGSGAWGGKRRGRGRGHRNHFAQGGMVGVQHFAVGGMTAAALARAGVSLGMVTQGEYSNGSLSAGTHLGGGVVDLATTSPAVLAALRANGFAAWARGPADGMSPHIHAVLMNHPDLSPAARAQVAEFLAGGDGLGAGGGGGGGIDIMGMLKGHIGTILKNVYMGLSPLAKIGGGIADFFGLGGDDDGGNGGLFGTGIGPDVGPDVVGAVGDAAETVMGLTGIKGEMIKMLGRMVLSMLDEGSIAKGLSDAKEKFDGFGGIAGGFGEIAVGMGEKILKEVMPDFLMEEKEKAGPVDFGMAFGGGGNVQMWAGLAMQALMRAGIPGSQLGAFLALMQAESNGNPNAINMWDSNAAMGQASRGLMQVIPSTFAAYRDTSLPNNIYDPLANMTAAARYIKARYGGQVPGSPYALGTPGATSGVHLVGEQGPELLNFRGGETVTPAAETASILGGSGQQMPEDMLGQYQLLAQKAQEMSTRVQAAWMSVSSSTQAAHSALTPVYSDVARQLGTTIPGAMGVMSASNAAHWLAMQTGTATTWTALRDGVYVEAGDHMAVKMPMWGSQMSSAVGAAWYAMSGATADAWEGMKEATRGPTNWIIQNSYNNGLARLWNEVAAVIFDGGGRSLPTVAALAKGGPVRGAGTGTSDSIPAMLSNGEHVWTAEEVRKAGGHKAVAGMRSSIMGGKPVQGASGGPGFALGGWLAGAGNVSGGGVNISVPELKRGFMMEVCGPLLDSIDSITRGALGGSDYRRGSGIADVLSPSKWMRDYITKDDELNRGGEGAEWARAQIGKPYVLGTFGNTFDCSTYMSGIATMIRDGVAKPWFTTHPFHGGAQSPLPGWERNLDAPFQIGITSAGIGHTGGTVNGENFEATPPAVRGGPAARGADHPMYQYRYGFAPSGGAGAGGAGNMVNPADLTQGVTSFDRGGLLQPGLSLVYNGTKKPEPVGHDLVPKGSRGDVRIDMPITINGNANAQEVVDGINSQVLPKLRQYLNQGTGSNG